MNFSKILIKIQLLFIFLDFGQNKWENAAGVDNGGQWGPAHCWRKRLQVSTGKK